jgi:flagella basal body P-ring formation protein FlgA
MTSLGCRIIVGLVCVAGLTVEVKPARADGDPVPASVSAAIAAYVAERLGVDASELRVRTLSPVAGGLSTVRGDVISVREARAGSLLGRAAFVIRSTDGGGGQMIVTADVERLGRMVVAARRLARFHVLTGEDLAMGTAALDDAPDTVTDLPAALIGKRLTRSIAKDRPVTLEAVEDAPVVQRGDRVTLRVQYGGLTIVTIGRAKEDGRVGRQIAVANDDSRKIVYGRVVDASTVAVEMSP